jgi:hypothetical protein
VVFLSRWKDGEKKGNASVKDEKRRNRHGYSRDDDFIVNSSDDDEESCHSSASDSEELCDELEQPDGADGDSNRGDRPSITGHAAVPQSTTAEKWDDEEWMKLAQASVVEDKLLKVRPCAKTPMVKDHYCGISATDVTVLM